MYFHYLHVRTLCTTKHLCVRPCHRPLKEAVWILTTNEAKLDQNIMNYNKAEVSNNKSSIVKKKHGKSNIKMKVICVSL